MSKLFNHIIVFALLIQVSPTFSQDSSPPDRAYITHVSVDTANNNVEAYWIKSPSTDVEWYNLYYEINTINGPEGVKFDSVSADNSSYTHVGSGAGTQSYLYSISAQDSSGNESLRTPGLHSTMYTSLQYDSCNQSITINWNKYVGWGNNVAGYIIYEKIGDSDFQVLNGVSLLDSFFVRYNISENTNYSYFVEAKKNDGLISRSNISAKYTYMPGPPQELVLDLVSIVSENQAEIHFHHTDTSSIYGFSLLRSSEISSDFLSVNKIINLSESNYTFYDSLLSNVENFYYKIGSLNSCHELRKEKSNLGTNILLTGKNLGNTNILNWNDYVDWDIGVEEYQLFQGESSKEMVLLSTLYPGTNTYSHLLTNSPAHDISGELIYQVKAKKNGEEASSLSNFLVIRAETELYMPNAFTPGSDGKNDFFKPEITIIPENYLMIIFDRYGMSIFKTTDPFEGWDGTINGKGMAPTAVYLYHVQYTSFNGTTKEKTGTLTLFYH